MTDTMPPPIDPTTCGPGTVPGWLNEDGLPTSCVGDLPMVEPSPLPTFTPGPAPVEPQPPVVDEPVVNPEPLPEPLPLDPLPTEGQVLHPAVTVEAPMLAETGPTQDIFVLVAIAIACLGVGWLTWASNARDKYKD